MCRLRPSSPLRERTPDRISSSGVPKAPPATITARRARTVNGRDEPAVGSATPRRHCTPIARLPSSSRRSASTPARTRAPAATARGR